MKNLTHTLVVVMGVAGCGKSTVGQALAEKLACAFLDADDFHPTANKEKMRAGIALNDDDRAPWLETLNAALRERASSGASVVLACSALKARYRDALRRGIPHVAFVHLVGTPAEIAARLAHRSHEYMSPALLASQFAALEPPTPGEAIEVSIEHTVDEQVKRICRALQDMS